MARHKYFIVVEQDDVGDAVEFARSIRVTGLHNPDATTYREIQDLLADFANCEGPWDKDSSKNVEISGTRHPWLRADAAT